MKTPSFLLPALLFALTIPARAEVKLAPVFTSHMVLQRQMPVPVWGTAAPGEKVTVKFRAQEKTAEADAQGAWKVLLDPLEAGGPETLQVAGSSPVALDDVLVGEVWVGSGQSNMQMTPAAYLPGTPTPMDGKSPGDKNLDAAIKGGPYPQLRLYWGGGVRSAWEAATPENLARFSALLQAFGLPLHKKLNVPVGLMLGAVGGTPSGRWLTPEAFAGDAACRQAVEKAKGAWKPEQVQAQYDEQLKKYEAALAAWKALPDDQRAKQREPKKPLMTPKPGESVQPIGDLYAQHVKPFVGYAIRGVLWDQGESGTAITGVDQYTLMGALISSWRKAWGQGDFPFLYVQKPSGGGCGYDYADPLLGWAADPLLPLPPQVPLDGLHRTIHLKIASYPKTFMVPASDLGSGTHPWNKAGYGARAAQVALGAVYGEKVETSGPAYAGHAVEGAKVRVRFTHAGQGLVARNAEKLLGFALAGEDKKFAWADAAIDGDSVVLSSDKVPAPVHAYYACSQNHQWANLFNKDGLPALPFRTDE